MEREETMQQEQGKVVNTAETGHESLHLYSTDQVNKMDIDMAPVSITDTSSTDASVGEQGSSTSVGAACTSEAGVSSGSRSADTQNLLMETMQKLVERIQGIEDNVKTCLKNQADMFQIVTRIRSLETQVQLIKQKDETQNEIMIMPPPMKRPKKAARSSIGDKSPSKQRISVEKGLTGEMKTESNESGVSLIGSTFEDESGFGVFETDNWSVTHQNEEIVTGDLASVWEYSEDGDGDENRYECCFCPEPTYHMNHNEFEKHVMNNHIASNPEEQSGLLWCNFCELVQGFKTTDGLISHLNMHKASKDFLESGNWKEITKQIRELKSSIRCSICSDSEPFARVTAFYFHCRSKHVDMLKPFKCKTCEGVSFSKPHQLSDHYIKQHPTPDGIQPKGVSCEVCGKRYAHAGDMRRHAKTHETCELILPVIDENQDDDATGTISVPQSRYRAAECKKCGKTFSRQDSLIRHYSLQRCQAGGSIGDLNYEVRQRKKSEPVGEVIRETPRKRIPKVTSYKCTDCDQEFNFQHLMETHVMRVHNHKPYRCPHETCGRYFGVKKHMHEHLFAMHQGNRILCDDCGISFARQTDYRTHVRIKHSLGGGVVLKPHVCKTCGKTFSKAYDLLRHDKIHSGTQYEYQCSDCGQKFTRKNGLNRHKLLHTGEKPFVCSSCGRMFRALATYKSHLKIHDPFYVRKWKRRSKKKPNILDQGDIKVDQANLTQTEEGNVISENAEAKVEVETQTKNLLPKQDETAYTEGAVEEVHLM